MSVRLILQYRKRTSHALTMCEPWTRWLVETESPSGKGHVIQREVHLRKTVNELGMIAMIEVEQRKPVPTRAQRYLTACTWWLQRAPFGVERLPVRLIAYRFDASLVCVAGATVTALDLDCRSSWSRRRAIDVEHIAPLLPQLEELHLCVSGRSHPFSLVRNTALILRCVKLRRLRLRSSDISDLAFIPLGCLEHLDLSRCEDLTSIAHAAEASRLESLDVSFTSVNDFSPLRSCRALRRLDARACRGLGGLTFLADAAGLHALNLGDADVKDLQPLASMCSLHILCFERCRGIFSIAPLTQTAACLRELDLSCNPVSDLTPLQFAASLCTLGLSGCGRLADLSPLAGAPKLRIITADKSGATILTGLNTCPLLEMVSFNECRQLEDLSPLAGAPKLHTIRVDESRVQILTGLNTCPSLATLHCRTCYHLTDLSPLAGAPQLHTVRAHNSRITNVQGLEACPKLVTLNLSNTPSAQFTRTATATAAA